MTLTDPFPTLEELPSIAASLLSASESGEQVRARQLAHQRGYDEGFENGYRDGLARAQAEARTDVSFALTALHGAIAELSQRDCAGLETMSHEAVDLAIAIAEEILGREVETASSPVLDALHRALGLAPDRGAAVARVHPDDLQFITGHAIGDSGREIELCADRSVERGACVLEVGPARIDAQIRPAIERVRAALAASSVVDETHSSHSDAGDAGFPGSPFS